MERLFFLILLFSSIGCNRSHEKKPDQVKETKQTQTDAFKECLASGSGCSGIDMDSSNAKEAYQKGCSAGDYYSCYRLGQYFEHKVDNVDKALEYYDIACSGKESYGCEGDYKLHMSLCYEKEISKYCNKREQKEEYRIIAFLENLDPKYEDSLMNHNFSYGFYIDRAESLFQKRLKEKEVKLLKALEKARAGKYYDGDGAETLESYIRVIKGGSGV